MPAPIPYPGEGLPPRPRLFALLAVMLAVGMATLDSAITNTALPTIAGDLRADAAASIWVVNSYQFVMVATLLPFAALADIAGHRRVFIAGLVMFTATSLACGLAWSLPTLVAARALQGVGAAAVMCVNTALIRFIYPARSLGRGLGMNALVVAVAFTIGPTTASGILAVASWHWLFLVNGPIGLLGILLALRTLPGSPPGTRRFDPLAALLCAGFFAGLILGLGEAAHRDGWGPVGVCWAVSAACGLALARREAGHPAPMLAADLLRLPMFALSSVTAICAFAAQGLAFVSLPFLLQTVWGHSQVETGLLMTPWPAVVGMMALVAGPLSDRYPPGLLAGLGLVALCLGMASLALLPDSPGMPALGWRLAVCGAGFGFYQSPNMKAFMSSAPPQRSGGASGILASSRLLGQTTGAALVALCLGFSNLRGPGLALWLGSAFAALGSVASLLRLRVGPPA